MNLDDLKKLAQAATHYDYCGQDECSICEAERQMHSALSPERILAMIAVIDSLLLALDHIERFHPDGFIGQRAREAAAAARAALEQQE